MTVTLFDHFAVECATAAAKDVAEEIAYKVIKPKLPDLRNASFEPYRVQRMSLKGARLHPTPLIESANLASILPPPPSYKPLIERHLITNGKLSLEQFETGVYALQAGERFFSIPEVDEPVRGGYLIGDATGVGKGRELSFIARERLNRRPTIVLWLSLNDLLIDDARRDWSDLGGSPTQIQSWGRYDSKATIPFTEPVLYGSYALLGREKRYDQLVTSLQAAMKAQNAELLILMDEAHAGINANPIGADEFHAENKRSARGAAMLKLQREFPQARVVYASATAASRLDALAYAERLNLWGSTTPFATQADFYKAMMMAGTAGLEQLTQSLKALGRMCARSIDFAGVEYETVTHDLDTIQAEQFNAHLRVGRMIQRGLNDELLRLGAVSMPTDGRLTPINVKGSPAGTIRSTYESCLQRAAQQHLIAIAMPTVAQYIQDKLDTDHSVVVQLTHTNAAALNRALDKTEEGDDLTGLDLTGRDEFLRFLDESYPIHEYTPKLERGKVVEVEAKLDKAGKPIVNPIALKNREALREAILELDSPLPALDLLYQMFPGQICEVTGRSQLLQWTEDPLTGALTPTLVKRNPKTANRAAITDFNGGRKRIIIISEACGGIGISLHNDIRFANQQRRVMVFLETSWRAEGIEQCAGRVARTGQLCGPILALVCPNVPGFRRFLSTPARRLANLGAIARGQRHSSTGSVIDSSYNLETTFGHQAVQSLLTQIANGEHEIKPEVLYAQTGIDAHLYKRSNSSHRRLSTGGLPVRIFLNRLLQADVAIPAPGSDEGVATMETAAA